MMENNKVEISIRIGDGVEVFYTIPEGYERNVGFSCFPLDKQVEETIKATTNIQGMESSLIRVMVVLASSRIRDPDIKRLEILLDDRGYPGLRNPKTGKIDSLVD